MAKGPSQGQIDLVRQVLARAAAGYEARSGAPSRAEVNARPRALARGMDRRAQAYDRRTASSSSGGGNDDSSPLGFVGDALDTIRDVSGNGLHRVLDVIDLPRAGIASGAAQLGKGLDQVLNEAGILNNIPDAPQSAKDQAANYAAGVLQQKYGEAPPKALAAAHPEEWKALAGGWLAENAKTVKVEQERYSKSYEPSFDDFVQGVKNHISTAQVVNEARGNFQPGTAEPDTNLIHNAPWGVNFLAGLGADVAIDPVARVMPGGDVERAVGAGGESLAGAGAETAARGLSDEAGTVLHETVGNTAADRAAEKAGARFAVGESGEATDVGREQVKDILAKLAKRNRLGALSADELDTLGVEGGYQFGGKNIGGQDIRNFLTEHNPLSNARVAGMDYIDRLSQEGGLLEKVRGKNLPYKLAARSGEGDSAVEGLFGLRGARAREAYSETFAQRFSKEASTILRGGDFKDEELPDVMAALQGDENAKLALGPNAEERIAPLRQWYDNLRDDYIRETGNNLPRLDDYVNRRITDEMRARIAAGDERGASIGKVFADFAKSRRIVPGETFLGEVVPDLPENELIQWANKIGQEKLGVDVFKTDLKDLMKVYSRQVANEIGRARQARILEGAGLLFKLGENNGARHVVDADEVARAESNVDRARAAVDKLVTDNHSKLTSAQEDAAWAQHAAEQQRSPLAAASATPEGGNFTPDEWAALENEQSSLPGTPPRNTQPSNWFDANTSDVRTMRRIAKQEGIQGADRMGKGELADALNGRIGGEPLDSGVRPQPDTNPLTPGEEKLNIVANKRIDHHLNLLDSMSTESAVKDAQGTAAKVEQDSQRSAQRLAAKVEGDAKNAARHLDAQASYHEAVDWARKAQSATDPLEAQTYTFHAQEAQMQGQLQEMGLKADQAEMRLTKAARGRTVNAAREQVQNLARSMFLDNSRTVVDPELIAMQSKVLSLTEPGNMNAFLRGYDRFVNWWKSWSLATPRFGGHLLFGHAFNNMLADVDWSTYRDFFAADTAYSKGADAFAAFAKKSPELASAYEQGREYVLGAAHDLGPTELGAEAERGTILPSQRNYLVRGTRRLGSNIQHMMRTTLAMDTILKGGTIEDAIDKIAMFHFDYNDLSTFERTGVRRVVPFYTWTRRNLPLQLRMLTSNPSVYAKYNDLVRNISMGATQEKVIPGYYEELGAFPIGNAKLQGSRVYGTAGMLPLEELTENWADPNTYLSQVAPPIKTPIELWAHKQFYKNLPLEAKQDAVPTALLPFVPVLKGMGIVKKGNTIDQRVGYVLEQFAPALGVVERQSNGDKYQDRLLANWINYITGLNLRVNTPEEKAAEKYRRSLEGTKPITIHVPNKP